jgi:amino acid adenylation domain-containing protein
MAEAFQKSRPGAPLVVPRGTHELPNLGILVSHPGVIVNIPAENIAADVLLWSDAFPERPAVLAPGRAALTYRGLLEQVRRTAAGVNALGAGKHDRVAMVLPNGPEMATAFLGVASGAIAAPLNPAYREAEFKFYLDDLRPKLLIVKAGADGPAKTVAQQLGVPVAELVVPDGSPSGAFQLTGDSAEALQYGFSGGHDVALVLHTSGTTARPKIVPLTHRNLSASASNIARSLCLSADDRVMNVMPLFHIHGLAASLLASISAGGSIFCAPGFYAPQFFKWIEEAQPTWYTAVPTMHQAILARARMEGERPTSHSLRFIRSSSAALAPQIMAELEQSFGAPVIEAYGMTEASHQMASNPLPPRPRKPGSVGLAAGPDIAILDEYGTPLSNGDFGEIAIRGSNVTLGYDSNPEANASAFVRGWFRTGDQGRFDKDGYLFLTGRIKEIINRGGEKIAPREIDEALLEHPAVAQAVAFAMPHPGLGEDVAAAVVLKPGCVVSDRDLREFAAATLADFKTPRRIVILDEIPKGPTGKIQRIGLAERLGVFPAPEQIQPLDQEPPRTSLEEQVADIWADVLGIKAAPRNAGFLDLGGDSMLAALLISRVRERFQVALPILCLFEEDGTVAGIASRIAAGASELIPVLRRREKGGDAPLSFGQESLWFLLQLERDLARRGNGSSYNRTTSIRLEGALDVHALERALNSVITRHEILRTAFLLNSGKLLARVLPHCPVPLQRIGAEQALAAAREPFDLTRSPQLRAHLIQHDADLWQLLLTTHHIVFDGWSMEVLAREVMAGYMGHELPTLELQYSDYAARQRSRDFEPSLRFWRERLDGAKPLLLPTDRPRLSMATSNGSRLDLIIQRELGGNLRRLAREEGATLFMALLTAFQTLLYRYSGQTDITIGSPVAGRDDVRLESLIGLFINTVAFRTDFSGGPSFREVLRRVRAAAFEAYAHEEVPFDRVVEAVNPVRNPSYAPLVQVMLILQNAPQPHLDLPGLKSSISEFDLQTSRFDLVLNLWERADSLEGWFEYNTDLFDRDRMERMGDHLQALLKAIAENPDQAVHQLPMVTDAERRRILIEWNNTERSFETERSINELFEEQARRTPDLPAVIAPDVTLSYAELEGCANLLAEDLTARGIVQGDIVGVSIARSPEMIVAVLGVLKAGAAYLPLETTLPDERMAYMVRDSGARLVVTREDVRPGRSQMSPKGAGARALAYVIYTSGSTGTPKGVMIEHRSVANLASFVAREFGFGSSSRVLQFSSFSFDASIWEIFPALCSGASLCVSAPDLVLAGRELAREVERFAATVLTVPPSVLVGVPNEELRSLQTLVVAGESCPVELPRKWASETRAFYNAYGPTEATVCATLARLDARSTSVSVGRPIANAKIYILDAQGELCPPGVPGEIYIAGAGVARGYLGRPELNAERFLPDPFHVGERMYRSGDRGQWRADGATEFLGRADRQVKVRGYRVELEEIEATLLSHPAVREAVVIARLSKGVDSRLVAYTTSSGVMISGSAELREFLKERLPSYMVPALFIALESMPRKSSGKVDRDALPDPETFRMDEPRRPFEIGGHIQGLGQLWKYVLGVEPKSPKDNFFELGGHSLLVARMLDQLEQVYGKRIPLATLLADPTIENLEKAIRDAEAGDAPPSLWKIQPSGLSTPFYFVHGDFFLGGFYCLELSAYVGEDIPFYGFPQHGPDGRAVPPTIEAMAADHIETLLAFQPHGPYLLGGMCNGGLVALEIARQLMQAGEQVDLVAVIAAAPGNERLVGLDYQAGDPIITEAYRAAMIGYHPAPFSGRVTLLWPEEEPMRIEAPHDETVGWGSVASEVVIRRLPGNHSTCISDYPQETASRLREIILEAEMGARQKAQRA